MATRAETNAPRVPRRVFFHDGRPDAKAHELATQRHVARRLAALLGAEYGGDLAAGAARPNDGYLVPNETLTSLETARRLALFDDTHLFGGVVPYPFVATKVISHGRIGPGVAVPTGWSDAFPARVVDAVLPGFSAFTRADARTAGRTLLAGGPVRIKAAGSSGGTGQAVVSDEAQLVALIDSFADAIAQDGIVLERDLARVDTYSIGLLRLADGTHACYVGTQHTTRDNDATEVYGGSTLTMYRGGFDELQRHVAADAVRAHAVALARRYHEAALENYAGMFASRANYDVVVGEDAGGHPHAGVLEQSWRIGGASGAEVAALEALRAAPERVHVRASTVERHGARPDDVPAGAIVTFAGEDPQVGPILKYTVVHDEAAA